MGIFANILGRFPFKSRKEKFSPASIEELRTAFKDRYHNFKVLLAANNKALEIMAEMEEALRGDRPFGMSFVRANCTAVSVNVFRIVKNLDQLAPGKYRDLFDIVQGNPRSDQSDAQPEKAAKGRKLGAPL